MMGIKEHLQGSYWKEVVFLIFFSACLLLVYRKSTQFCISILYIATLLKVFINSQDLLVKSLGSLMYRLLFTNTDTFASFPIPFITFACLITLVGKNLSTLQKAGWRAVGGTAQQLILHATFLKDPNLASCTHIRQFPSTCNFNLRGS